eukprot:jgi/Undpi1/8534/HiC_scaffold_25.g11001.m1
MGRRRVALLGLAMIVLLVVDTAAGSSKGASRPGSQRRSAAKAAGSGRRSNRNRDEEREFGDHLSMKDGVGEGARRPKSKSRKEARSSGSARGRSRPSPASSSRSSSRYHEAGRSRERPSRGRGMELVPSRRSPPKSSMFAGLAATMKGKAASMQEDAKGKVTEWRNIAKTTVWFSSKMEKFMIQMTWPDDGVLDDVWVKDTMNFLESAGDEPPRSPNNPNKRILRKLWLRMTEEDYRTKLKALQILHHTTMDLSPEAHARVRSQFMRMRDETNHKNRNEVYFEPLRIMDVTSSGMPFLPLLRSYSSFTFKRMTDVQGGPKQLVSTMRSKKTSQHEAVALLRRLDKLICVGMRCSVDRKTLNTITGQVMQLAARDMMNLWKLYVKGLTMLIRGGYKEGKPASPEAVAELLRQYSKTQETLQTYLHRFKKIVRDQRVFEDNQVDPAALEVCLASVAPAEDTFVAVEEEEDEESFEDDEDDE